MTVSCLWPGKDGRTFRVCDFEGMQCLYRNRNDLLSLQWPKTMASTGSDRVDAAEGADDIGARQEPWCKCDRNCDDSYFFVQRLVSGQNNFVNSLQRFSG